MPCNIYFRYLVQYHMERFRECVDRGVLLSAYFLKMRTPGYATCHEVESGDIYIYIYIYIYILMVSDTCACSDWYKEIVWCVRQNRDFVVA